MYKREDFGKAVFWLASTSWVRRMGFVFLAVFISVFYVRHTPQCARRMVWVRGMSKKMSSFVLGTSSFVSMSCRTLTCIRHWDTTNNLKDVRVSLIMHNIYINGYYINKLKHLNSKENNLNSFSQSNRFGSQSSGCLAFRSSWSFNQEWKV